MLRRVPLVLILLSIVALSHAQDSGFILGFFTNANCNFGNANAPAPTPFSLGGCTALPGAPAGFPGGHYFNSSMEVGGTITFNVDCNSACTACQEVNLDLSTCTALPGGNFWAQWFEILDKKLEIQTYLDPNCKTKTVIPEFPITSGNCTDTGSQLTDYSILSLTSTNEVIVATNCKNADCDSCVGVYKRHLTDCFEIINDAFYFRITASAFSVASSLFLVAALLALLLM